MIYQTFEPGVDLVDLVKCYWTMEDPAGEKSQPQTIVPDGHMEMIFHYGDLYKQYVDDGTAQEQPRAFVFGQLTRPLTIEPTGVTGIFSVRFYPAGFIPFSNISIQGMMNRAVSLDEIFGRAGNEIETQILKVASTEERIKIIEIFLKNILSGSGAYDRIVKSIVDTIFLTNGSVPIQNLVERTGINRRQLERKFQQSIGLSPKQLSKTIRLQNVLTTLLENKWSNYASIAYDGEYYDQAHFIKDFKEFTGMTPREFYGDHLKMSTLFYGSD